MKLKEAFNLVELMLFLIIISVILSIVYATLKPRQAVADKNVRYKYAAAYDALNIATFDLMAKDETNPFIIEEGSSATHFQKLCNGFAEYINTESENCAQAPIANNVAFMKDEELDFKTLTPHLTSLNGMKFYISDLIKDTRETKTYATAENPDLVLKFFMVYVDINGKEKQNIPHSIKYDETGKNHPSVFAFAVIPTGDAIPMGLAEYNIKYLSTRIAYRENHSTYYSPYYSFREAKHAAWNMYQPGNPNIKFNERISFTYNDYIKEILDTNNTQLYKFNKNGIFPKTFSSTMFSKCVPTAGTVLTPYDMCSINVDTPTFRANF